MSEIKQFWSSKASVIFVWPGEEDLEIGFDAQRFVVPPRNKAARKGVGSRYAHESARDSADRFIHGTIVVEDMTEQREGGGFVQRLSVDMLCRFLQRDRQDLFLRGFNIVQNRSDIEPAMHAGLPLYNASQDARAREVLATELERQKHFAEKGQPAPPSSSAHLVEWAIQHLQNRPVEAPKYSAEDITKILEGRLTAPPPQRLPEPAKVGGPGGSMNATVFEEAEAAGVKLGQAELRGLLRDDPEVVALVVQKIKGRAAELAGKEPVGPLV